MSDHEFSDVSDVSISPDGIAIALTIKTSNGASFPLSFQHKKFAQFIEYLIAIGAGASKKRTDGRPVPIEVPSPSNFSQSLATQIALAEAADRSKLFFVVRLYDMDLSFRVEKPTLQRLAGAFVQAVQALDADESTSH